VALNISIYIASDSSSLEFVRYINSVIIIIIIIIIYSVVTLYRTTEHNFDRLQKSQNTLARVVLQASWSESARGLLQELHWLTIRQCVRFKIAAITYKTKHSGLPTYLSDDLQDYQPARTLRSSTTLLLHQPQCFTSLAVRSFIITAPDMWNLLSVQTRSADRFETSNVGENRVVCFHLCHLGHFSTISALRCMFLWCIVL